MWSKEEVARVSALGLALVNQVTYAIGGNGPDGKWVVRGKPGLDETPTEADCSGWSRWLIGQGQPRILLPHGCIAQLKFCTPVVGSPQILDLGFADLHGKDGQPDHVIIKITWDRVIECRGEPYNKVFTRPISVWEAQRGMMGFWRVPGIYDGG